MYDFKQVEEKSRGIWKSKKAGMKKAVQDDKKKKIFSFLEGPPTANAPPGLHHLEVRTFKDIINKFRYMQGFAVPRKAGWDCHGLPVEVQVEKKLKLASKKDVVKYGVSKFIKQARDSVFSYINDWNISTEELGYLIDLDNPYVTLDNNYIESVWWSLSELYSKKMLYETYKVVPYCPRCGTPLSSHEVAQGYKNVTETSIYVKFELVDEPGTYLLAWTTTPWTLPGNSALYVGKDFKYVKIKLKDKDEYYILAKDRLSIIKEDYEIVKEVSPKQLVGKKYRPLFDYFKDFDKKYYHVDYADFVDLEQGTGLVHSAIMYGEVDFERAKEQGLKTKHIIGKDGRVLDTVPVAKGLFYKDADPLIIKYLEERNLLYKKEKITHSYPHCWRCGTPLLYYAIISWFINVEKVKEKMIKLNKKINWEPKHIRDGRFGKWLEGAKDWALSRSKFWGTPLPIWRCDSCKAEIAIGSIKELKEKATKKLTDKEIDLHKPWIDGVKLRCKCGKEMVRIPDVIDCWYDSGAASFAQFHYPFENKKEFKRRFPYDFISEAIDQTRGWFYTLHVLATILFGKPAYKNVICAGHVVDEKGEKMSKSKGNIIVPREIIDQAGVDAIRLQFCMTEAGNPKRFSYDLMKEAVIPFLTVLYNINNYYNQLPSKKNKLKIEDKWILSRLNSVIKQVTGELDNYHLDSSFKAISDFVVNDFSRVYIKMTRDRDDTKDIVEEILEKASLLLAPFAPYISEYIYSNFSKESVHLSSWPKIDKKKIDKKLEEGDFYCMLWLIEKGLAERDKIQIGLKWPLAKAKISYYKKLDKEFEKIMKNQLNVKKIEWKKAPEKDWKVELDTKLTPELEAEGFAREISRKVQSERKKAGLVKEDKIKLSILVDKDLLNKIKSQEELIKERTNSSEILFTDQKTKKEFIEFNVKKKKIGVHFG